MLKEFEILSVNDAVFKDAFKNFDINKIPKDTRDVLYKSYTNSYMMSIECDDEETAKEILAESADTRKKHEDIIEKSLYPLKDVVEGLTGMIPEMRPEQFITFKINGIESLKIIDIPNFWVQPVISFVPDKAMNIAIINEMMTDYGYINVRQYKQTDEENREWWVVIYNPNPKFMKDVRNILRVVRLIHYSPEFNRDDILENGLLPSKGGRTYLYPDERVFFYVTNMRLELSGRYISMMKNISKKVKKEHRDFSGYFDMFELMTDRLPENVKILYDPNMDSCVYLSVNVPAEWLVFDENFSREF